MLVPMVKPVLAISVLIKSSRLELLYYAVCSRHQRPEGSHHLRKHEQVNRKIYSLHKPIATGLQTTYIWLWAIVYKLHLLFFFCSVFFFFLDFRYFKRLLMRHLFGITCISRRRRGLQVTALIQYIVKMEQARFCRSCPKELMNSVLG